ncbi:MAG: CBS domain-containing protein [Chloroflexi bacterium]|nr:CBS domain-containing protein [Chloroflexota bacterium]
MPRGIKLGEVFGIPVRVHYTWFIASALIIITLALTFRGINPLWQNIILGIIASLLFFASMCARALAQSSVAINRGMLVRSVTLYVFGGVPRITEQDTRPIPEILMAITGPFSSLVIAGIFYALSYALAGTATFMPAEFMQWLFYFNIMMALFNLIPAFPLDGGRALRAILQLTMGDYSRATRIATFTGRVIGFLLIAVGILAVILPGNWFAGVATAVFGWFLEDATTTGRRRALVRDALRGITAQDMMTQDYTPIKQQISFGLVREYIINSGQHCFVVIEDGKLQGIVTLGDIQIPEKRWDSTRISDIMTPAKRLKTAQPDQPAVDLLEQMDDYDIDQIPVVQEDRLVGMVTRERLLRFLKARAVLKA